MTLSRQFFRDFFQDPGKVLDKVPRAPPDPDSFLVLFEGQDLHQPVAGIHLGILGKPSSFIPYSDGICFGSRATFPCSPHSLQLLQPCQPPRLFQLGWLAWLLRLCQLAWLLQLCRPARLLRFFQPCWFAWLLDKCLFGDQRVSYLGFTLTPEGIKPGKAKLKSIQCVILFTPKIERLFYYGILFLANFFFT